MYHHPSFGVRIVTKYPYHWVDPEEQRRFSRYAADATHLHWKMLSALRKAVSSFQESEKIKNYIFKENVKRVFRLQ